MNTLCDIIVPYILYGNGKKISREGLMFKNRIKERRKELGFSQTQLACSIGMAGSTLSNLELGKVKPWPKARRDLANALGMTESQLFPDDYKK